MRVGLKPKEGGGDASKGIGIARLGHFVCVSLISLGPFFFRPLLCFGSLSSHTSVVLKVLNVYLHYSLLSGFVSSGVGLYPHF
jgi:hypothetical protein